MTERGTEHPSEIVENVDPGTGTAYTQLTGAAVDSIPIYFEHRSVTGDGRTLLFVSRRYAMRGSPSDVYRIDLDGRDLVQLSDERLPLSDPRPDPLRARVVYGVRGNALLSLDIDTFEEREVIRLDVAAALANLCVTRDGAFCFARATMCDGTGRLVRMRTDGSEAALIGGFEPTAHVTASRASETLQLSAVWSGRRGAVFCDFDGDHIRPRSFEARVAHAVWHGPTDRIMSTLQPPERGISLFGIDEGDEEPLCAGAYFWHACTSDDGEWIVADTNWPDEGLMLVHVPSGRYRKLIESHASNGHPQETHPHPFFSPDGSQVIFASDRTGLAQIYACTIPSELKADLADGTMSYHVRQNR